MTKRWGLVVGILFTLLLLVASQSFSASDTLSDIKARGKLLIGVQSIMPAIMLDEKSGKLVGVDGEVAEAIARDLGVKTQKVETAWEGLIPGLNARKYDTIISGMYIKPDRQKVVNFTDPYYTYGEGLAVAKGNPLKIKGWDDLKGKRLGLQEGTAYLEAVQKELGPSLKELKIYKNIPDMTLDLDNGRIDAYLTDKPIIAWDIAQHPNLKIELVSTYVPRAVGKVGAATRKADTSLLNAMNQSIRTMKANGGLLAILKRYGLDQSNVP
jgi:polar amino acid transport system substrate-binding protein